MHRQQDTDLRPLPSSASLPGSLGGLPRQAEGLEGGTIAPERQENGVYAFELTQRPACWKVEFFRGGLSAGMGFFPFKEGDKDHELDAYTEAFNEGSSWIHNA